MISDEKILEAIGYWNKWIYSRQLKLREIVGRILKIHDMGKNNEVIDIVGVRRAGKSSIFMLLIQELGIKPENLLYVNFEEPLFVNDYSIELLQRIWEIYRTNINPEGKPFIFFDEIQLVPAWEKWIRKVRDLEEAHVFITGSSKDLLSREYGTALTGRHISFKVFPLHFLDYLSFHCITAKKDKLEHYDNKDKIINLFNSFLIDGGFPEIVLSQRRELLKNYFDDILYRDIIERHQIRDVNSLKRLAVFCLTNISNLVTYNSLRKQFSVSLDTIREYLSYFEESFLVFQVPIYSYSLKIQEISPKKIYCIDNGLRNAVSFSFSKDYGRLAENCVFIYLKRSGKDIYYWKGKGEVDFIVKELDQGIIAINVCYSNQINNREIESLKEFKIRFKKVKQLIVLTKNLEKKENGIRFIPLWKFMLEGL